MTTNRALPYNKKIKLNSGLGSKGELELRLRLAPPLVQICSGGKRIKVSLRKVASLAEKPIQQNFSEKRRKKSFFKFSATFFWPSFIFVIFIWLNKYSLKHKYSWESLANLTIIGAIEHNFTHLAKCQKSLGFGVDYESIYLLLKAYLNLTQPYQKRFLSENDLALWSYTFLINLHFRLICPRRSN